MVGLVGLDKLDIMTDRRQMQWIVREELKHLCVSVVALCRISCVEDNEIM